MRQMDPRLSPGLVRDAILQVMSLTSKALSVKEIEDRVNRVIGLAPASSVRSYLNLNTPEQQAKLRSGRGGVWRIPPSFDGHTRSPVPRFTTLTSEQLRELRTFFFVWARLLLPKLVPGAQVVVASNPLVSYIVSSGLSE